MSKFDLVTKKFDKLNYMTFGRADFMRQFIIEKNISDILEIGFFHGKSSAYFGAILDDLARGSVLTIDRKTSLKLKPNINDLLKELDLNNRVKPIFSDRSYTWELGKLIQKKTDIRFDFCYFDGGHTWDFTGFGFVLVNILLRPGGWIIFDDLDWTINGHLKKHPEQSVLYQEYSNDEKSTAGVRLVFENLIPTFGYKNAYEVKKYQWGVAQKP